MSKRVTDMGIAAEVERRTGLRVIAFEGPVDLRVEGAEPTLTVQPGPTGRTVPHVFEPHRGQGTGQAATDRHLTDIDDPLLSDLFVAAGHSLSGWEVLAAAGMVLPDPGADRLPELPRPASLSGAADRETVGRATSRPGRREWPSYN